MAHGGLLYGVSRALSGKSVAAFRLSCRSFDDIYLTDKIWDMSLARDIKHCLILCSDKSISSTLERIRGNDNKVLRALLPKFTFEIPSYVRKFLLRMQIDG